MRIFYIRLYATQLWRYVVCSLRHDDSLIEGQLESAIVSPFTEVDDQIAAFCTAFANLRKDFDSRLSLTTALFVSQTASSVDMMGTCSYAFVHSYVVS